MRLHIETADYDVLNLHKHSFKLTLDKSKASVV